LAAWSLQVAANSLPLAAIDGGNKLFFLFFRFNKTILTSSFLLFCQNVEKAAAAGGQAP